MEDQAHRKRIFDGYLQFIDNLKTALNIPFFQWINGSFTTQKQFPGDKNMVRHPKGILKIKF